MGVRWKAPITTASPHFPIWYPPANRRCTCIILLDFDNLCLKLMSFETHEMFEVLRDGGDSTLLLSFFSTAGKRVYQHRESRGE